MTHVLTVGGLLHFILRWCGWWPLFIGLLCGFLVIGASAMSDAPEEGTPFSFWACVFVFGVGVLMEITAFFVR